MKPPFLHRRPLWPAQATGGDVIRQGDGTSLAVPSGQGVTLQEIIQDAPGAGPATYRFRFLAPDIARDGGSMDFDRSIPDMQHLCDNYALAQLPAPQPDGAQVIISFADRPVPFGETAPEATQFFVAFEVRGGVCLWQPF